MFTELLSNILLVDESKIKDNLKRNDIENWDSMTHLILISELEANYNITFNDDDIASINTVGDIKKALEKYNVSL